LSAIFEQEKLGKYIMIKNNNNKKIHDNEIINIEIDIIKSKIDILTVYKEKEKTKLIFTDVLYHEFKNIIHQNVIFDFYEKDINIFIDELSDFFLENRKYFIPPIDWENIEDLKSKLFKQQYNAYILFSSYGMTGWVIAKEMSII
jgi:hypothetical protein